MIDKVLLKNGNVIKRNKNQFFVEENKTVKLWETKEKLDYLIETFSKKNDVIFCVTK